jgi:Membrane proteins related to metalloendopeptidases
MEKILKIILEIPRMKHPFSKRIKKIAGQHVTLMVIPNSCNEKVRCCEVPFVTGLIALVLVACNIYIFFAYSIQIWQIVHFQQKVSFQNQMIAKLSLEKSRVIPVLDRNRRFEMEFNRYCQENREMLETWNRVRQKGNFRFTLASRNFFRRGEIDSFTLPSITKPGAAITSLDQLDHNLGRLESILGPEMKEQEQLFHELKAYEQHLDHTPSIWPVYARISSPFGERFHPILRRHILHEGVDLAAEFGTKIRATADGRVSFAGWMEGYGLMIIIDHDYGYETRYGHTSSLFVHTGETVKKGQVICLSGNTGESTGPHLHYEVRINGKPVNPVPFLKE